MPRFAANLTMLWNELDFLDRFEAAARAGFEAVEFLFPYPYPAAELRARLEKHQLQLVLHNLPAGDWVGGERGIACLPDRVEEFRGGVGKAIEYATALGVKQLNCLVGKAPAGVDAALVRTTVVDNLRFAADALAKHGIRLLVEPVNTRDIPGFWLHRTQQALALMDEVGSTNLFLQYDIYHMQIMEGDLAPTMKAHFARIAHLQLADNPGRNEPGTGEINYPFLFDWIDGLGYAGWIGCEYKPATTTDAGLGWLRAARERSAQQRAA
jgi:hydroxypyruvate isomerase